MTSKQRAYLKSLAMKIDPIYNIGKGSISPELVQGVRDALEARELIKIGVLQNCMDDPKELANVLAERTRSQVVQVIGKKIVLYKESKNHKRIELPKAGNKYRRTAMKKIGILGGTFNPIHHGHLILGQAAKEEFGLDEILVMPTKNPAYKKISGGVSEKNRVDMIKLAIRDFPYFKFSDIELKT